MRGRAGIAGVFLAVLAPFATVVAVGGWAGLAHAEAPTTSLRPQPRPVMSAPSAPAQTAAAVASESTANAGQLRPRPRPAGLAPVQQALVAPSGPVAAPTIRPRPRPANLAAAMATPPAPDGRLVVDVFAATTDTLRPKPRPEGLATVAAAAPTPAPSPSPEPQAQEERRGGLFGGLFAKKPAAKPRDTSPVAGSVCGDPAIRGEDVAAISSKVKGCGVEEPVRVTAIDGIRLNSPATVNCGTAVALKSWIDSSLRPSFAGRDIVELRIAASYICRPRNNVKGNKISEHGRGNAVDVAGVVLSDGTVLTVAENYSKLRRAYKGACGIFGTTLGPGSDGYHEDHMHFDTVSYRNGPYCR